MKWLSVISILLCAAFIALFVLYLFASGTVDFIVNGPKIIMEEPSPDGQFIAYVKDMPSLDGPNQALLIEREDKTQFLGITKLAGDVDSIKEILWAPDGSFVVYHSHLYLTATRLSDWRTIRIYLGREWRRAEPQRQTTFSGAMPRCTVTEIDFPKAGTFAYRLSDDESLHTVDMETMN